MSISCQTLYNDVCRIVGLGTGNDNLSSAFTRAVNRSLDKLSVRANLEVPHAHITQINTTISTLNAKYEYVLASGVMYYIVRLGFQASDPRVATVQYRDSESAWEKDTGEYVSDLINIAQSDEDEDIALLGKVST